MKCGGGGVVCIPSIGPSLIFEWRYFWSAFCTMTFITLLHFRFRRGYCKHNPRKMVKTWAEKEMRNLVRYGSMYVCMYAVCIRCVLNINPRLIIKPSLPNICPVNIFDF